jgi:hypothetical protein
LGANSLGKQTFERLTVTVRFGSAAVVEYSPKAASRAAGIEGKADVAIRKKNAVRGLLRCARNDVIAAEDGIAAEASHRGGGLLRQIVDQVGIFDGFQQVLRVNAKQ